MKRNLIETILGAVVLFVAIFFVVTTYNSSGVKKDYSTTLTANFDKVDGITAGSDVRLGGIKIGSVIGMDLDPKTYRAKLDLGIQDKIGVPTDSSAVIDSDGLLGGKYVNIVPGADSAMLKTGGEIEYTQSSVNLEELIGKFAFGSAGGSGASGSGAAATDKNSQPNAAAENKTSLDTPPAAAPVSVAAAPVVTQPKKAEAKKAEVVDVVKPAPAQSQDSATPAQLAPPQDNAMQPPQALPATNTPPPAAPSAPVTITPKIVRMPEPGTVPGDTQ